MTGFTDRTAQGALNSITGKSAMPTLVTPCYLALFTAVGTDAGTGFTEVSGGSYARVAMAASDWNAASGTGPSSATNANAAAFPTATADWGTVIAWGIYDASTSGNLLMWDYLGDYAWKPFSGSSATPCVLTSPAHGYSNGDSVVVSAEYGGALPATGGSWSGVKTVANVTTDTFTVGVNSTGTGSGMVRKVTQQSIPSGILPSFASGQITLVAA